MNEGDVETALLDAELYLKYNSPDRAIRRLRGALEGNPRSIQLRERLRELTISQRQTEEAARQCLALAKLYIEREDLQMAHDRLLEAKQLDARISIAPGLDAIRRARQQGSGPQSNHAPAPAPLRTSTLSGDLNAISLFDVVQVVENSRLTGALKIIHETAEEARVLFNEGRIVGALCGAQEGEPAFRQIVQLSGGGFEFERAAQEFPTQINTSSNTKLILDSLQQIDEENRQ